MNVVKVQRGGQTVRTKRVVVRPMSLPKAKMNPRKKKLIIVAAIAGVGLVGLAYYLYTQGQAASAPAAAPASVKLTVNGDTGLTQVRPGRPTPFIVMGTPGNAVVINQRSLTSSGAGTNPTTVAAGVFDSTGTFTYETVMALSPYGPTASRRLPFLTKSGVPMVTYDFQAIDTTQQVASNTVQVTVSIAAPA